MKPKRDKKPDNKETKNTAEALKAKPPKEQCAAYLGHIRKVQQECTTSIQDLRLHKMKESRGVLGRSSRSPPFSSYSLPRLCPEGSYSLA